MAWVQHLQQRLQQCTVLVHGIGQALAAVFAAWWCCCLVKSWARALDCSCSRYSSIALLVHVAYSNFLVWHVRGMCFSQDACAYCSPVFFLSSVECAMALYLDAVLLLMLCTCCLFLGRAWMPVSLLRAEG